MNIDMNNNLKDILTVVLVMTIIKYKEVNF